MKQNISAPATNPVHEAIALYKLTAKNGMFMTTASATDLPFCPHEYSKFKYGCRDIAEQYAMALAKMLLGHFAECLGGNEQIVVIGTPYKRLPNAARLLAIGAERYLRSAGLPTKCSSIYQHRLATGDYGMLSADLRDERNFKKKRFFDPDDFSGKHVVIIDDIRITGSIERSMLKLLSEVPVLSTTVVNLVCLDPEVALREPQLEDRLNHYAVKSLDDLLQLIQEDEHGFVLISRAVKFILQSKMTDLVRFLEQLTHNQLIQLYEGIVEEGYDTMSSYDQAYRLILDTIHDSDERKNIR